MINTKAHALIDYGLGIILVASPWLFDFDFRGIAYTVNLVAAALILLQAATTRFEYSVVNWLPLRFHLLADIGSGIVLAFSPWIFGFYREVFKPHLVFGLTLSIVALLTDRMLFRRVRVIQLKSKLEGFKEQHQTRKNHSEANGGKN